MPNAALGAKQLIDCIVLYSYSASCSAHQSEALPVREIQREESRCLRIIDCHKYHDHNNNYFIITF